jgi:hypothetical protein
MSAKLSPEQMKAKLAELEDTKKQYIDYLLEQRKGIDEELAQLGHTQAAGARTGTGDKRGGSRGPMSDETKAKIAASRAGKKGAMKTAGGESSAGG